MADEAQANETTYHFRAEIKQLLDILVHSLYKEREIFIRELISNASDALTRIHFEMLTNPDVLDPEAELAIHIETREADEHKTLIIKDSGIGMTREELIRNLGTIAQSGAREFLQKIQEGEANVAEIIGQFGVGFYSVFMAADEVWVISRSFRPEAEAAAWVSSGGEDFQIEPAEKQDRGTEIHIRLKKDAHEFVDNWQLKQIIRRYSNYVNYPIYVGEEQANEQRSLWRKPPSEVTADEYRQFYQQLTLDFEEPLVTIHLASDAPIHLRALLFVPARREKSVLHARQEPGLKLYSHNVLIQEYCQDLLPKWLEFVDGVVDSEDLPLNVSRETIQNTRMMRQLGKTLRRRVLRELQDLIQNEADEYTIFWNEFGRAIKEGLATDPDSRDEILPLLRFSSSRSGERAISLDAYIEQMADDQEEIYYLLGDDRRSVAFSPHLDPFKSRDLEVLYWVDPIDPFLATVLTEYKEKTFRNIDDPNLDLPESVSEEIAEQSLAELPEAVFNRFIGRCVTTLGDRVAEVRSSKVLKDSPVRLLSPDDMPGREMQRIYRYLNQDYQVPQRIMEINRNHPLIIDLARLVSLDPNSSLINLSVEQLYESALVQEGLHPNPAGMLPRIQELMALAAASATGGSTNQEAGEGMSGEEEE